MCCDLAASNGPKPQNKTREHPRGMSNRLEPKQTQCCKREEQQVGKRQTEGGREGTCEEGRRNRAGIVGGSFGGGAKEESEMFSQSADRVIYPKRVKRYS